MSDGMFYRIRDESKQTIIKLLTKYYIKTEKCNTKVSKDIKREFDRQTALEKYKKHDILLKHDLMVINFMYEITVPEGAVKMLCTWDRSHFRFRSVTNYGYDVLTPIAVIDLFSLAKPKEK